MPTRYFEDFAADQTFEAGSVSVTEAEIIAFARQYDPQAFHVDPAVAHASIYGGLIASGWHTVALSMRLLVDAIFADTAGMGSPGVDELRWLRPIRPGDTLSVRLKILEARASESRPDRGIIRFRVETRNQDGDLAMHMTGAGFIARRPESPPPQAGEGESAGHDRFSSSLVCRQTHGLDRVTGARCHPSRCVRTATS